MNSKHLEELRGEAPTVFQVESLVIKSIELIEKKDSLQRPADSGHKFLLSCRLPFEVEFQDGLMVAGLELHLRPPSLAHEGLSSIKHLHEEGEAYVKGERKIGEPNELPAIS
jgi:hypothetical protein